MCLLLETFYTYFKYTKVIMTLNNSMYIAVSIYFSIRQCIPTMTMHKSLLSKLHYFCDLIYFQQMALPLVDY